MFIYKVEEDRYGKSQTHYWLTQGDSCGIISTPKDDTGTTVLPSLITEVKFKISDPCCNKILFEKVMPLYDNNKYILNLLPSESANLEVGKYNYEIEYTLVDGGINTPNQWRFDIIQQGTEV